MIHKYSTVEMSVNRKSALHMERHDGGEEKFFFFALVLSGRYRPIPGTLTSYPSANSIAW